MALDDTLSKDARQTELELTYEKNQLLPRIKQEILDAGFEERFAAAGIAKEPGLTLLAQMHLHKRAPVQVIVGLLRHHFEKTAQPAQAAADMLMRAAQADLVNIDTQMVADPLTQTLKPQSTVIVIYELTADVQEQLDRFQYPLPMIVPPQHLEGNKDTAYLVAKRHVMLHAHSLSDELDFCLDHLNRVNSIPLKIDNHVATFVQNQWRNLDRMKEDETWSDFRERKVAFKRYDTVSRAVISLMIEESASIWLTHAYDFRGRTYAQGYHVNYQGNDWNKAVITFAREETLNEE